MQPKYFKDQMTLEFAEAIKYLNNAIDTSQSDPELSKKFKVMADSRLSTAFDLYSIFMQVYVSGTINTYTSSLKDLVVEEHSTKMSKINDLRSIYQMVSSQKGVNDG